VNAKRYKLILFNWASKNVVYKKVRNWCFTAEFIHNTCSFSYFKCWLHPVKLANGAHK